MKRIFLTIFILCVSSVVCAQGKNFRLLKKAYKKESKELLHNFFEKWDEEIPPISDAEFAALNDTSQHAYRVFEAFYTPRDLTRLVGFPYSESYADVNLLVVQNEIRIGMRDRVYYSEQEIDSMVLSNFYRTHSIDENDAEGREFWKRRYEANHTVMEASYSEVLELAYVKDTLQYVLHDFRPRIATDSAVVYLSRNYEEGLSDFMRESEEEPDIWYEKQRFLENGIYISGSPEGFIEGSLENPIDIVSQPTAQLFFDPNFEYCLVRFWIFYSGGEAIMKRNGEKWELISSKQTWIY